MPLPPGVPPGDRWHTAAAWAASGVMDLSGPAAGPPSPAPRPFVDRVEHLVDEIGWRSEAEGCRVRVGWEAALAGRAAMRGYRRAGTESANRSCRLLDAGDGWVACNLARPDDRAAVPALTGRPLAPAPPVASGSGREVRRGTGAGEGWGEEGDGPLWAELARAATELGATAFVDRARLLGLAAARLGEVTPGPEPARPRPRWISARPRHPWHVVDLSALWAGPVAARVLAEAGASVTKVESVSRPDPARLTPEFYDWVHGRHEESVSVDLRRPSGLARLRELLGEADVVIEASRPRALEQLGLGPDDLPARAGRVWLSITGHGRDAPMRDWVAFGDDAAVAGGLVGRAPDGSPVFLGDAIADPLTGLAGALAVLRSRAEGGGQLLDVAMSRVASSLLPGGDPDGPGAEPSVPEPGSDSVSVEAAGSGAWVVRSGVRTAPVATRPVSLDWIGS